MTHDVKHEIDLDSTERHDRLSPAITRLLCSGGVWQVVCGRGYDFGASHVVLMPRHVVVVERTTSLIAVVRRSSFRQNRAFVHGTRPAGWVRRIVEHESCSPTLRLIQAACDLVHITPVVCAVCRLLPAPATTRLIEDGVICLATLRAISTWKVCARQKSFERCKLRPGSGHARAVNFAKGSLAKGLAWAQEHDSEDQDRNSL
mmetsp:Transcript_55059/g.128824  ORF Transcript_55059/g.128824 Transcript_55059/m.128824 type:complete len:203 (-) Transcript_55059:20-628(-)